MLRPLTLFTILGCLLSLHGAVNAEGKAVLAKVYELYGGKERIAAFKSMVQNGTTFSSTKNNTAALTRTYRFNDALKITKEVAGKAGESRLLNGDKGWRDGKEVTGMMKSAMVLQASRMMVPKLLMTHEKTLRYNGKITRQDGTEWYVFRVPLNIGGNLLVQVDPATYYIRATVGMLGIDQWRTMQFITVYDDFKHFDGYLFASREEHYAMDKYVGWTKIDKITFPKALPHESFRP